MEFSLSLHPIENNILMKPTMKKVKIEKPCAQIWEQMEKGDGFNFCAACSKNVIDFSGYTNAEIIKVLSSSGTSVCGRLSQTQLNQLNYHLSVVPTTNRNWMKYLGVLAIGASVFAQDAKAENLKMPIETVKSIDNKIDNKEPVVLKKIYGYIVDADNKPISGIKLYIIDTKFFASTDKNGRYEITLNKKFNASKNKLTVESILYEAVLILDFSKEKQNNLKLKKAEPMIMGEIIFKPIKK